MRHRPHQTQRHLVDTHYDITDFLQQNFRRHMITITTMRPVIPISARGLRVSFGLDPCTRRRIHATPWVSKSVKEKISEVADKVWFVYRIYEFKLIENFEQVNKKVGEGLATAIETGEKATEKTKKTLGKQNSQIPCCYRYRHAYVSGETTKHAKGRVKEGADQMGQQAKKAGNDVRAHHLPS